MLFPFFVPLMHYKNNFGSYWCGPCLFLTTCSFFWLSIANLIVFWVMWARFDISLASCRYAHTQLTVILIIFSSPSLCGHLFHRILKDSSRMFVSLKCLWVRYWRVFCCFFIFLEFIFGVFCVAVYFHCVSESVLGFLFPLFFGKKF